MHARHLLLYLRLASLSRRGLSRCTTCQWGYTSCVGPFPVSFSWLGGDTLVAQITWSVKPYLWEGAKHEPFACQPVVFIPSYFFILLAAQRAYIVRGPRRATSSLITFVHLQRYISLFPPSPPTPPLCPPPMTASPNDEKGVVIPPLPEHWDFGGELHPLRPSWNPILFTHQLFCAISFGGGNLQTVWEKSHTSAWNVTRDVVRERINHANLVVRLS